MHFVLALDKSLASLRKKRMTFYRTYKTENVFRSKTAFQIELSRQISAFVNYSAPITNKLSNNNKAEY